MISWSLIRTVSQATSSPSALVVPPTNDVREALAELHKDLPLLVRTPHTPVADDLRWEPSLAPGHGWPIGERTWVNPSPNAPNLWMARCYAGTVMLEGTTLSEGRELLGQLVSHDDWLPEAQAQPDPQRYQQFLLYADPRDRFSVVSFVWGPGQATPIHNHTVWGLVGMLRGQEQCQAYVRDPQGRYVASGETLTLLPGQIEAVSPTIGDIHLVRNGLADRPSISIHVYGANIGKVPAPARMSWRRLRPLFFGDES